MRIAVLLFGQPRYIEHSAKSILEEFTFDGHDTDFFCHFWSHREDTSEKSQLNIIELEKSVIEDKVEEIFSPKSFMVEDKTEAFSLASSMKQLQLKINNNKKYFSHIPQYRTTDRQDTVFDASLAAFFQDISHHLSIEKVVKLKQKHEEENNFKYDLVIRIRSDLFFKHKECYKDERTYNEEKYRYYIHTFSSQVNKNTIFGHNLAYFSFPHTNEDTKVRLKTTHPFGDRLSNKLITIHDKKIISNFDIPYQKLHFKDWVFFGSSDSVDKAWSNLSSVCISCYMEDCIRYLRAENIHIRINTSGERLNGFALVFNKVSGFNLNCLGIRNRFALIREKIARHGWKEERGRFTTAAIESGDYEEMKSRAKLFFEKQ